MPIVTNVRSPKTILIAAAMAVHLKTFTTEEDPSSQTRRRRRRRELM